MFGGGTTVAAEAEELKYKTVKEENLQPGDLIFYSYTPMEGIRTSAMLEFMWAMERWLKLWMKLMECAWGIIIMVD